MRILLLNGSKYNNQFVKIIIQIALKKQWYVKEVKLKRFKLLTLLTLIVFLINLAIPLIAWEQVKKQKNIEIHKLHYSYIVIVIQLFIIIMIASLLPTIKLKIAQRKSFLSSVQSNPDILISMGLGTIVALTEPRLQNIPLIIVEESKEKHFLENDYFNDHTPLLNPEIIILVQNKENHLPTILKLTNDSVETNTKIISINMNDIDQITNFFQSIFKSNQDKNTIMNL